MKSGIRNIWARWWACLITAPVALALGACVYFAAFLEGYAGQEERCRVARADCREPSVVVMHGLEFVALCLVALAAVLVLRACTLRCRPRSTRR